MLYEGPVRHDCIFIGHEDVPGAPGMQGLPVALVFFFLFPIMFPIMAYSTHSHLFSGSPLLGMGHMAKQTYGG